MNTLERNLPFGHSATGDKLIYAVYHNSGMSTSVIADGLGSGTINTDDSGGIFIGVADSKEAAKQLILKNAYDNSASFDVYGNICKNITNENGEIEDVNFSLTASWTVKPILMNQPVTT